VLVVVAGIVIYSYGWTVTNINLAAPQEPQRQTNVGNALRELLSPNIFTQSYEIVRTAAPFLMDCAEDGVIPEADAATDGAQIAVSPGCGSRGDQITVHGSGFVPEALGQVRWTPVEGESRPRTILETGRETFNVAADGSFSVTIEVPSMRGVQNQTHQIEVDVRTPVGLPALSDTTHQVISRMVETIFLALVATTLSILPSVILSFLAARNLMKPIHYSLGNLMVGFALLPVGALLGAALLGPLGAFAVRLGSGSLFGAEGAATVIFTVASVTASRSMRRMEVAPASRVRSIMLTLVFSIAAVFVIGLIGGLGVLFGTLFKDGALGYVSNFIGTLGGLVQLTIVPIAGIVGAFALWSVGTTATREGLKAISGTSAHVLGGLLGAICGAILMGGVAAVARQGALLGLLVPFTAAILAGSVLPMLYNRLVVDRRPTRTLPGNTVDNTMRFLLMWVGIAVAFYLVFVGLNIGRSVVEGVLPSAATVDVLGQSINAYVFRSAVIGLVLGALAGAIASTRAAFPLGDILYNSTRTILNALRSIEPLIMGLVFVIWVGIGPFAGVLALTLHSIASLGKLYSEQVENIDAGPIEALESTGANRLQTIMYGVVPQIIPPYIAFTMYRWDINVRMSTIIGFVGGGGIGFLLQQQLNLLRYRDAGVAVLAIAIIVSILDYTSASIRERYI
jgi:phosphonate ABC transporter permease subunit PhnE